ncbi:MAG: ABC transporter permease [Acidimicrobiia bacterium]|nr:ABC transporter permease [Acidimicrobiia bacterium]
MDKLLTFSITGLSLAAIYAIGASGLVLTYTTTGIFNFAHGAIGMIGAFAYWQLRFDWGWPAPIALAVVLVVMAPLFGVFLEAVIMRSLEGTSDATKLVVSISLLSGLIGLANWIWQPGVQRPTSRFFQGSKFTVFGVFVSWHEATALLLAVGVALALRFLLHRTGIGIAMRAAVDDRDLAMLNGARPNRGSMLAWALGCSLAALSGILFVGTLGLEAGVLALLIVNAYAAAIVGRLRSLPLTFVGALILGLGEAYWQGYRADVSFLSGSNLSTFGSAIPVMILFAVLLVLPNPRLKGRAARSREFFAAPSRGAALAFSGVMVVGAYVISGFMTRAHQIDLAEAFAFAIIALSFVPLVGMAGRVSLCQLSFAGIGAVTMAHLGNENSLRGLVAAVVITAAVGALVALPALRLSGIYLALATAAFAVALDRWVFQLRSFEVFGLFPVKFFEAGSVSVNRVEVGGISTASPRAQAMLLSIVFALLALFVTWIRRNAFGRRLLALKESEAACATFGMNLTLAKLTVFALAAGIAGLGGALYGGLLQSVNPGHFSFVTGLPVFMLAVVGGIGSVGGALNAGIGLATLAVIPNLIPALEKVMPVMPGLVGIGLGRNPSGGVQKMTEAFAPVRRSPRALLALTGALALLTVLRSIDVIGNWPYVLLAMAVAFASPLVATTLGGRGSDPAAGEGAGEDGEPIALEWVGLLRPFTDDDRKSMDLSLGHSSGVSRGTA